MDLLSELRTHATQAEVLEVQSESTEVRFEANRLKSTQVEGTQGIAARVVLDGRLGFAASSDMSALDRLVTNVLESAAYGERLPIAFPGPQPAPEVATYDPAIPDLPIQRLVEIGQEAIDYLLQIEPDARVSVNIERGVQHVRIRNDAGADVSFERSPLSMSVEVDRVKGDDVLIVFTIEGTTAWQEDTMAPVRRLGERLERAKRSAKIASGRMPVLFAPGGALTLALPLSMGVNGKNVYTGTSPIRDKVGQALFDPKLTLVDDATIDHKFASAAYDDEGVAHRRTVLVEEGVLKGFLYDLKTAAQSGVDSTGNGSRSLFGVPRVSPTNLILQPGDTPLAEMIAGIDHGLLVEDVLGLGQGNVLSGAFSNPLALAFLIEHGEIVGRVKDVSIAGNIYDVLTEIAAISQESEWVYYSVCLPYLLLPDMNVVAKA
ncbi:MAG: TldD/PmbA family protein [Anaerolineae bacterium]|nr:TldD/PmbA family protein [Anaerolineae bacterium]